MKKSLKLRLIQLFFFLFFYCEAKEYDLTLIGRVVNADGLCRIPITLIDILHNDLAINHIQPFNQPINAQEIKDEVKEVLFNPDKTPGNVSLIVDGLWSNVNSTYVYVPESRIKISYSMFESDRIPAMWVEILNNYFDAVVVPDSFLKETYFLSGVKIPIFVLPICLDLNEFLNKKRANRPRNPFTFGCTASGVPHKNQLMLIQAFIEEFGNTPEVTLRLTCRGITHEIYHAWHNLIQDYGCTNIQFNIGALDNNQYLEFMDSLDCYVNISKGEGFSIGPREALALGIPSILTNNSAQKTICSNGLVRQVTSDIAELPPSEYSFFGDNIGLFYNCKLEDVKDALRDVYENYDIYLEYSKNGPDWAAQYCASNLKDKYLNLIKPKKVIFGKTNEITDEYLMTTSQKLYNKYIELINSDN